MTQLVSNELLNNIRELLHKSRKHVGSAVNSIMVHTYWHIGYLIVEEEQKGQRRSTYGKKQLAVLSDLLTKEFGRGFDVTNLRNMRRLYLVYPIRETLSPELSWSHYLLLMRITNQASREWYGHETIEQGWSVRALERQIDKLYYERLISSQDKSPVKQEAKEKTKLLSVEPKNYLRDPYILEFLNLPHDKILETDLESKLLTHLQAFLLELGKGFAFVERQQKVKTDGQDFAIDLVFYNFKLKCFVLIDCKIGKLTHQDVGQMDTYVRIYDQHKKARTDNPTVGLILCREKSEAIAKYSVLADGKQIFASKYFAYLPTEEELIRELVRETDIEMKAMSARQPSNRK